MNTLRLAIITIAACAFCAGANAQKTFKCGNAYSQTPCADGVAVDAADARTDTQKQQADAATRRDATAAQTLEKERLAREKSSQAGKSDTVAAQPAKVKKSPFVPYLKKKPKAEKPPAKAKKPPAKSGAK